VKIRIKDIAIEAGVSPASVSNALNGKGGVSGATARRIISIAQKMGYIKNKDNSAINKYIRLVSFKRHGLVIMNTQFFAEMIEALERQCHIAGLELIVSNIHMEKDSNYLCRIQEICQEDCAGILLLATEMYPEDVEFFHQTKAPLLVIDSLFRNKRINCVMMNNEEAGYIATEHLIRMGHTCIHHITSRVSFNNMIYRRIGFESAMSDAKLLFDEYSIWRVTPTLEGAYQDMSELLKNYDKKMPTAFFVANDIMAIGCMRALKDKGYKVPTDISIIGMDDLDICKVSTPALSTVRVLREEIARTAIKRLLTMMETIEDSCVLKIQVDVEFVERQSVRNLINTYN
jgi:LacI family transcriptional regulator